MAKASRGSGQRESDDRHYCVTFVQLRSKRDRVDPHPCRCRMSDSTAPLWQRIDPRRRLGAAIGWTVFIVVAVFAVGAGLFAASEAEDEASADSQQVLSQYAADIAHALAVTLETRTAAMRTISERIAEADTPVGPALQPQLDAFQRHFDGLQWLGVTDATGKVIAATDSLRVGADFSTAPWFRQAIAMPSGPPVFAASAPRAPAGVPADQTTADAITMALRMQGGSGLATGVLLAAVSWNWIDLFTNGLLSAFDKHHRQALDLLLASSDGTVLSGPPPWLGRRLAIDADLSEDGKYLVGRTASRAEKVGLTDWTVIVRQPAAVALARTGSVGRTVFLSVLIAGLLSAAIALVFVRMLLRRLGRLAGQARSLQDGRSVQLAVPPGRDEISHLGAVLAALVDRLQREKAALEHLNAELDQRVAERTARIERLAEDARHAAITRERLRIARDLHDTLAHSMMALLTQIRLVRKLRGRWSEAELDEELAQAEAVAASGLREARDAIGQIRHNGVREVGLGPALQGLVRRFRERTGLATTLQIQPAAASLADERAETAFRIVEEALHNVQSHARAQSVAIDVASTALPAERDADQGHTQRIRLEVADDGIGFDPDERPHGHYGLRGMHEQAALIEARLTLACAPGRGAQVVLEFDA